MSNTISDYVSSSSTTSTTKSTTTLDTEAFIRLMVTQLSNQNPLDPMDDTQFYAQMAQLGTVQGIDDMKKSMQASEASSYLGKTVTATISVSTTSSSYSKTVSGTVAKITNNDGTYTLSVKDSSGSYWDVDLANITSVEN